MSAVTDGGSARAGSCALVATRRRISHRQISLERRHTEKTAGETAILDAVLAVAKEVGVSPTEVAIAWQVHKAAKSTTSLIPILGSRTREQLDATLGALEVKLSPDQIARLDTASAIPLGTLHEQINGSAATIAGGRPELLDSPPFPVA